MWGPVPRQHSSGNRNLMLGIRKRGDNYRPATSAAPRNLAA